MRAIILTVSLLTLAGCASSSVATAERDDDASCRKIIADRGDARPNAYQDCRQNLMEYRRNKAIAAGSR